MIALKASAFVSSDMKAFALCSLMEFSRSGMSRTVSDIKKCAKGAEVLKGLAIQGSKVDNARKTIEEWNSQIEK